MNEEELSKLANDIANLLDNKLDIQTEDKAWLTHNDNKVLKFSGARPLEDRPSRRTKILHICLTLEAMADCDGRCKELWLRAIGNMRDALAEQIVPEHGLHDTPGVLKLFLFSDGSVRAE